MPLEHRQVTLRGTRLRLGITDLTTFDAQMIDPPSSDQRQQ
jgi:hypothetical protein